jgi:uncharacterized protein
MVYEIPLFPLNTVLFPGMPLQLHIFEERYKQMIRFCSEKDSSFGVVLIKQGAEAMGPVAEPFSIGCSAKITNLEPISQGRFNLLAVGQERFQVIEYKHDLPYLVGRVRNFPLQIRDLSEVSARMDGVRPWFERYLHALGQGDEMEKVIHQIPTDPQVFAYLGAVVLQIPLLQKQRMIETVGCLSLLDQLEETYRREVAILENTVISEPPQMQGSFSRN